MLVLLRIVTALRLMLAAWGERIEIYRVSIMILLLLTVSISCAEN